MPRYDVYVPRGKDAAFQRFVANAGGSVYSRDTTVGADYIQEAQAIYEPFVARLQGLLAPHPDPYFEDRRISGFNAIMPELSGREVFQTGDIDNLPEELMTEFRESLVGRFISGLNPKPTKVLNGQVAKAIGTPIVEMIMLQYGLEDGVMKPTTEVARLTGITDASKLRDAIKDYFGIIRQENRLPRKQSTPMRETMFKIRRRLEIQRVK